MPDFKLNPPMTCENPRFVWPDGHIISVGCGKCIACLSSKRSDWAFRIYEEYKRSKSAAFITLTYSNRFLPDDGVSKRHLQLFMKRLRKHVGGEKLRYYAVGEYGSDFGRPHYHILLFNSDIARPHLERAWSLKGVSIGLVDVRQCNIATIKYVLKYVIQRKDHKDKRNPPFALMSRSYGLGLWYLTDEMVAWHRADNGRNYTLINGVKGRLPRYYKNFIWPDKKVRKEVMQRSFEDQKYQVEKFHSSLKKRGYDVEKYTKEMRDAFNSRVKEKLAFSQKF